MKEATAVVEDGRIVVPTALKLPNGTRVRLSWDEDANHLAPLEDEEWTLEELRLEIDALNRSRTAK